MLVDFDLLLSVPKFPSASELSAVVSLWSRLGWRHLHQYLLVAVAAAAAAAAAEKLEKVMILGLSC